jgi:hypothetical protein
VARIRGQQRPRLDIPKLTGCLKAERSRPSRWKPTFSAMVERPRTRRRFPQA